MSFITIQVGNNFSAWQRANTLPERFMMTRYFKILVDGKSCHGGNANWSLPDGDNPGKWMPKLTKLVPCKRGYHIVLAHQIPQWLKEDCQIFELETSGKVIAHKDDKFVCGKVRLIKRMCYDPEVTPRLFAADCAEHILHFYEDKYPDDDRPRKSIDAARKFARKQITREEMAAVWAAAWYAAWDAARAAARAAAGDAAGDAARAAARDAAWAAARAAARDAAGAAAWAAEQQWQGDRLLEYLDGKVNDER